MTADIHPVSTSKLYNFLDGAKRTKYLVADTEGDGRDVRDLSCEPTTTGVTLTYRDDSYQIQSEYFAFFHMIGDNQPEFFEPVCELLNTHPCVIFHNAKHDIVALELWDVKILHFYCTMIMQHMINENLLNYGLDALCKYHKISGKDKPKSMQGIIDLLGWDHVPVHMMRPYSVQDGIATLQLFEKVFPEFCAQGLDGEIWHWEEQWIRLIAKMEKTGIRVDSELCLREIEKGEKILADVTKKLDGRNPRSRTDLHELLINQLKLPVIKMGKTGPSFDKEVMKKYEPMLERMGSPVAKHIITYRGWGKVVSTNYKPYIRLQGEDGRIRPNYNLHRAVTRRLTCGSDSDGKNEVKSPNLQNIPRTSEKEWDGSLKAAFIPEDGYVLWDIDFSQIELRLAAVYSGDPRLIEIFKSGRPLFDEMAEQLGWPRYQVKTFVYATSYNAGNDKIARTFGISNSDAAEMREQFNGTYTTMVKFKNRVSKRAERTLYTKYWTGARRHYLYPQEAGHLSWNSLIQGGAAEILKRAAVRIGREIDWDTARLLLQVHDSLVPEIKIGHEEKWLPLFKNIMEDVPSPVGDVIPFPVEIKKWGTEEKWVA